MKLLLPAILLLVILLYSCGNHDSFHTAVKTGTIKTDSLVFHDTLFQDTFFIYRYLDSEFYTGIYLSKEKEKADAYKQLMHLELDSDAKKNLVYDCKYASDSFKLPIKKFDLSDLTYDWVPLVQYKKKYYVYPCRVNNILTDSILIFDTQDGFHGAMLQSVTRPKTSEYTLHYKNANDDKIRNMTEGVINIYILNPKTKLAVWETIENGTYRYKLCAPKESAVNYNLIEENSNGENGDYRFEKIDFNKLIRESQQ